MLSKETLVGIAALGAPLLAVGLFLLRRMRPVQLFYVAALAIGLGYLAMTGATGDIGASVLHAAGIGGNMAHESAPAH